MSTPINNRKNLLGFQKSYAFLIGINNYPKINAHLRSAVNDAKALAQVLKHQQGFDHVELLVETTQEMDEALEAKKQAKLKAGLDGIAVQFSAEGTTFRDMLARIQDPEQEPKINPQDCIVFYYAGHGKPGEFDEGPAGYLLPSDTRPDVAKLENDSLLPMEDVFKALKTLNCHHTLLILDCCFAGKFRQASKSRNTNWISNLPLYEERFMRYKRERAWQVLVSAGPHQTAADWLGERQELTEDDHSPFAQALLDALAGKAELSAAGKKLGDGVLTSQELFLYLWDKVERLTNSGQVGKNSQYPDLFPMSNHQGGQFIFFDPNNKLNFAERILRNPYQGLKPFETSESDLFFGRKIVIKTLLPHLLAEPLLVLTGPSGSGKSSLVKAGLFPALMNWENETGEKPWADAELFVLRPGARPWTGEPQYPETEEGTKKIVYTGLQALLPQLQKDKKQVLLIDQYEEFFTDGATEEERTGFETELIARYKTAEEYQLKIIITLRSDYEWQLEESAFGQVFWQQDQLTRFLYRLPPMRADELREALVNPALAELYEFETEKLVEIILAEIGHAPGALPMLSFTMSRFYEETDKDTRVFKLPVYKAFGGVNGALSKYADDIYNELTPALQDIMQKLIIRMVRLNDGSYGRRRVYARAADNFGEQHERTFLNEFDYPDHQDALVQEVLELLETKHLLLTDSDQIGQYYEPIHDILIQHWKTAKQWIAQFGAANIGLQRDLWQAVLDNTQSQKKNNDVKAVAAEQLEEAETTTAEFSKLWDNNHKLLQVLEQIAKAAQHYFLKKEDIIEKEILPLLPSENRAHFKTFWDETFINGATIDLNALILPNYSDKLLDIFLLKGNHWLNEAEVDFVKQSWNKRINEVLDVVRQRDEAIKSKALAYSSIAENMPRDNKNVALRIAQLAYKTTPVPLRKVSHALGDIFYSQLGVENDTRFPIPVKKVDIPNVNILDAYYTPSGQQLIVVSQEAVTAYAILMKIPPRMHQLRSVDGALLADLSTKEAPLRSTSYSPDGKYLFTTTNGGALKKWELSSGKLVNTITEPELFAGATLAPNGQHLLTRASNQKPQIWTVEGKKIAEITGSDKAYDATYATRSEHMFPFLAKGDSFVYIHGSGEAGLYEVDGTFIADLNSDKGIITQVHSSGDIPGFWVVRHKNSYMIHERAVYFAQQYDETGTLVKDDFFSKRKTERIYFSPDSKYLLAKIIDANACLIKADGRLVSDQILYESDKTVVFSPTSTHFAIVANDLFIHIWSVNEGKITDLYMPAYGYKSTNWVKNMTFSPDGQLLVVAFSNGTAKIWDLFGNLVSDMIIPLTDKLMGNSVNAARFAPDGRGVMTASNDGSLRMWTAAGPMTIEIVVAEESEKNNIAYNASFSPDGKQILVNPDDMPVEIWSRGGMLQYKITVEGISQAFFIDNESTQGLITLSESEPAQMWDEKGELSFTFPEGSQATAGAFYADGQFLTTVRKGEAYLWQKEKPEAILLKNAGFVVNVCFVVNAGEQELITFTQKSRAIRYNLSGEQLGVVAEGTHIASNHKASATSFGVLTNGGNRFEYFDGRKALTFRTYTSSEQLKMVKFSADETYLLLAIGARIELWDLKAGLKCWERKQDQGRVSFTENNPLVVDISPNTKFILSGTQNGGTYIWSLEGALLGSYNYHHSKICSAVFSSDGQSILTASSDRMVKCWPVPERIFQWLEKEATIPELTAEQREQYGLEPAE